VAERKRAHIYMHWDELIRVLGLKGHAIKVYSEPDNDYLHIFLESDDPDVGEEDGFHLTSPGGYVEAKALGQVVKDPEILRRSGNSYFIPDDAAPATTDA
jgi:hypothetical protein